MLPTPLWQWISTKVTETEIKCGHSLVCVWSQLGLCVVTAWSVRGHSLVCVMVRAWSVWRSEFGLCMSEHGLHVARAWCVCNLTRGQNLARCERLIMICCVACAWYERTRKNTWFTWKGLRCRIWPRRPSRRRADSSAPSWTWAARTNTGSCCWANRHAAPGQQETSRI